MVFVAHRALDVDEAAREVPALQVLPKLLLHVLRKRAVVRLARVTKEVLQVLLHQTEEPRFRAADAGRKAWPAATRRALSRPRATTRRCNLATLPVAW